MLRRFSEATHRNCHCHVATATAAIFRNRLLLPDVHRDIAMTVNSYDSPLNKLIALFVFCYLFYLHLSRRSYILDLPPICTLFAL